MDLSQYTRALRLHWKLVAATLLLAVGVAGVITLLTQPVYSASSSVFVSPSNSDSADPASAQANTVAQNRVVTYSELLTGRNLAQRVIDSLGLKMTAGALAAEVSTEVTPGSLLLSATITDASPERAVLLANSYTEQFVLLIKEYETPDPVEIVDATTGLTTTTTPTAQVKLTVTEVAVPPNKPTSPNTQSNLALGAVLGLMLGILLALLRDLLDNTVKTGKQVEDVTGGTVLGGVLYDADMAAHPVIIEHNAHSPTSESYRQIRTNLKFVNIDKPPKVLVITSSISGEGKSTTAINLAVVLAQSGQRVALVEADLRRPRITRYMGLVGGAGLTNVLTGTADLADVMQPFGDGKLSVLAGGPHPPNPSEMLGSAQMAHLLDDLREHNDYVIIDAPPLLPVTDAAVLALLADGAVLVTRYGSTKRDLLRAAVSSLETIDARLVGTIINMVSTKGRSSYGDGYGYGYSYQSDPTPPEKGARSKRKLRREAAKDRGRTTADQSAK